MSNNSKLIIADTEIFKRDKSYYKLRATKVYNTPTKLPIR